MVQDRGNIKWSTLMLPEHVEMLQQLRKKEKKIVPQELDEQALEHLNEIIYELEAGTTTVVISYSLHRDLHRISGRVTEINFSHKHLVVDTKERLYPAVIPFHAIIAIETAD